MRPATAILAIPSLRLAVAAALDAGITPDEAFVDACTVAWSAALPAIEHRLPYAVIDRRSDDDAQFALEQATRLAVAAGRRGTWTTIVNQRPSAHSTFHSLISAGGGVLECVDWSSAPTFGEVLDHLVKNEVHSARQHLQGERFRQWVSAAISAIGICPGAILRHLTIGHRHFLSATVLSVDERIGTCRLLAVKPRTLERCQLRASVLDIATPDPVEMTVTIKPLTTTTG
ncbi:hypothetical protein IMW82_13555 [Rhodanobacter sp. B2A1Ga4]|uniref:hypothetical protein n=1 Tax=Rhodanobacter sp. B2A1Ga4 TaxID=2778647 RepID=UPI001B389217|nr:hypothetical protein [Rhodanobacter sp. B2A1Ga4]MBQ4855698.1 hypothetical protein [Rhodanobacter sp. B2A1Ga4]